MRAYPHGFSPHAQHIEQPLQDAANQEGVGPVPQCLTRRQLRFDVSRKLDFPIFDLPGLFRSFRLGRAVDVSDHAFDRRAQHVGGPGLALPQQGQSVAERDEQCQQREELAFELAYHGVDGLDGRRIERGKYPEGAERDHRCDDLPPIPEFLGVALLAAKRVGGPARHVRKRGVEGLAQCVAGALRKNQVMHQGAADNAKHDFEAPRHREIERALRGERGRKTDDCGRIAGQHTRIGLRGVA